MKQKIILLMVLMAGLAACSKDDEGGNVLQASMDSPVLQEFGKYEGGWFVNQKYIETDTLTVSKQTIIVKSPSEPLLKYIIQAIPYDIDDVRLDISNSTHCWFYVLQGYSENKSYSNLYNYEYGAYIEASSFSDMIPTVFQIASGKMYDITDDKNMMTYGYYSVFTDKPMLAIFDNDTRLWTLKITLNKLKILEDGNTDKGITDLLSPIELVCVATKKI